MTTIDEFYLHPGERVEGQYRVIGWKKDWNSNYGALCTTVRLSDYSGTCSVLISPVALPLVDKLSEGLVLQATIIPKAMDRMMGGVIEAWSAVEPPSITNIAQTLPFSQCPTCVRPVLKEFVALIDRVGRPEVRQLLNQVINACYEPLLRAQAGWQYHHNYPGGLLIHSVSVARMAEQKAHWIFPGDRARADLIVAGSLLHDYGKLALIRVGPRNPLLEQIRHEALTLPMCFDALLIFGRQWPEGGRLLGEILNWQCLGPKDRASRSCREAELIHNTDMEDVWMDRSQFNVPLSLPAG